MPPYNKINDVPFSLSNLLMGLHVRAGWTDCEATVGKFEQALVGILSDFAGDEHRWEYNSIKHGLRASHGRFALLAGIEETYGVSPPPEAMQTVGYSRDASFFEVAKPLENATKQASKINFHMAKVTVAWSLEKVIFELQILSILLHNTVSALKIAHGDASGSVTFNRPANCDVWWAQYFSFRRGAVPTASFSAILDAKGLKLPDAKDVFASYRRTKSKDQR